MMAKTTMVKTTKSPIPLVKTTKSFGPMNAKMAFFKAMPRAKPTMTPEITWAMREWKNFSI